MRKALDEIRASLDLLERRELLAQAFVPTRDNHLRLGEVNAALNRISRGTYGVCEICNGQIEAPRLSANPLLRFCLPHTTPEERLRFEEDQQLAALVQEQMRRTGPQGADDEGSPMEEEVLETANRAETAARSRMGPKPFASRVMLALKAGWRAFSDQTDNDAAPWFDDDLSRASIIQSKMLPGRCLRLAPWDIHYTYAPLAEVGGDYCDLVPAESGRLFFFLGDAVGKGISASLIASHLHALFRALVSLAPRFEEMPERANRIFCESMATGHYATLVCGHASPDGTLELVNAGHPAPLLLRLGQAMKLEATGLPLGLFYTSKYEITRIQLAQGETLLFYTDGVTEARNSLGVEYGSERLARLAAERHDLMPEELVRACLGDLSTFTVGTPRSDDLTMMAMRHR